MSSRGQVGAAAAAAAAVVLESADEALPVMEEGDEALPVVEVDEALPVVEEGDEGARLETTTASPDAAPSTGPAVTAPVEADVAEGDVAEALGLDAAGALGFVVEQRRVAERAAAVEMRAVTHYADLHRCEYVGAVDPEIDAWLARQGRGQDNRLGLEGELRLAGEGAFAVEEFAVAELAAALRMSEAGARGYVGESLELRDRLPRLWGQVMAGVVPAWKARKIAAETIPLNAAAADYVDRQLAPFAAKVSLGRALAAVQAAIERHDPDLAAKRAARAADKRGVWVEDRVDGTSEVHAVTDTPDAAAFDTAVSQVAASLAALGDADGWQARRAKAVGVLADPQHALDLHTTAQAVDTDVEATADARAEATDGEADAETASEASPGAAPEAGSAEAGAGEAGAAEAGAADAGVGEATADEVAATAKSARRNGPSSGAGGGGGGPVFHLHLHTDAVAGTLPAGEGGVARVTGLGPRALAVVEQWLQRLAPGAVVKLTPVVDLTERVAADAYEVPDRLRRQVEERDLCCSFPWCGRKGRFDVDHIDPYVPPEDGGPPGQTNTANTARLCRFHHRVKTHPGQHGRWEYRREPSGVLTWTSPLGRVYAVDETGTFPR